MFKRQKGFTFLEVVGASMLLVAGAGLIYGGLFQLLDIFSYCQHYWLAKNWIEQKLWEMEEQVKYRRLTEGLNDEGEFVLQGKVFRWRSSCSALPHLTGVYRMNIDLSWQEGKRNVNLRRSKDVISSHF